MLHRFTGHVRRQVLLRHISHVVAFVIFSQKMVKRLILPRTRALGDIVVLFLGVRKLRIDVKNDTTEGVFAVTHDLTEGVFGVLFEHTVEPLTGRR